MRSPLIERRRKLDPHGYDHVETAASAVPPSAARRRPQARCACRTAEGGCPHINDLYRALPITDRSGERGVTIALVAVAMFSIIAMAGLSIDIGTLYEASAEAQRAADAGALAAARYISMSGVTGDTSFHIPDWSAVCGGSASPASTAAITVAQLNTVAGQTILAPTVTYGGTAVQDCSAQPASYAVNPTVTVLVRVTGLPTYFSRIWGRTGSSVSATATAEVFNPSNSGQYSSTGEMVPIQPRCVKPWIVPNKDPGNPSGCTPGNCLPFVTTVAGPTEGSIQNPGILIGGVGTGVIGESFTLTADCAASGNCNSVLVAPAPYFFNPPQANGANTPDAAPSLQYLPGQVVGAPVAVPGCGRANPYQEAVAGCDQSTPYQCGVQSSIATNQSLIDLTENPIASGDTSTAAQCLIHQSGGSGQDTLLTGTFPYQIQAGASNPLKVGTDLITSSNSIVTLPIYDDTQALSGATNSPVTIVGFLQVFIQQVNLDGSLLVVVLNVAGCGNAVPSGATPIYGSSPVPVRLITSP